MGVDYLAKMVPDIPTEDIENLGEWSLWEIVVRRA